MHRRLSGPQNMSERNGEEGYLLPLPEMEPRYPSLSLVSTLTEISLVQSSVFDQFKCLTEYISFRYTLQCCYCLTVLIRLNILTSSETHDDRCRGLQ
jgi:hypothetical protein